VLIISVTKLPNGAILLQGVDNRYYAYLLMLVNGKNGKILHADNPLLYFETVAVSTSGFDENNS